MTHPLTTREYAVLELTAQGLHRREIAERLGIGPETVKHHMDKIRRKLGARNRAHAVAIAIRGRGMA